MNSSYMLYQAEHVRTAREQREEDIRTGELAAELGRLWRSLAHRRPRGFRQAPEIEMLTEARAGCSGSAAASEGTGR
jgi:hypothetical protein